MRQLAATIGTLAHDDALVDGKHVLEQLSRVDNLLDKCDDAARETVVDKAVADAGGI